MHLSLNNSCQAKLVDYSRGHGCQIQSGLSPLWCVGEMYDCFEICLLIFLQSRMISVTISLTPIRQTGAMQSGIWWTKLCLPRTPRTPLCHQGNTNRPMTFGKFNHFCLSAKSALPEAIIKSPWWSSLTIFAKSRHWAIQHMRLLWLYCMMERNTHTFYWKCKILVILFLDQNKDNPEVLNTLVCLSEFLVKHEIF